MIGFNNFNIGFEFEFYIKDGFSPEDIKKEIEKIFEVTVKIIPKYHSKVKTTYKKWKLEKDYSGGLTMYELITHYYNYSTAVYILQKILDIIKKYGYTTNKSGLHINISHPELVDINLLKFIINYDEDYVYTLFPERKNNIFAHTIKCIVPKLEYKNIVFNKENIKPEYFKLPVNNKAFGVNFSKLYKINKKYIEIRYIGGEGYETKYDKIIKFIEYTLTFINNILSNNMINDADILKLNYIINKFKWQTECLLDYNTFKKKFPNINILFDLEDVNVPVLWTIYSEPILNAIIDLNLDNGTINYDTNFKKVQIKNAQIKDINTIQNYDLVSCVIYNVVSIISSTVYDCNITNVSLIRDTFIMDSDVLMSNIKNSLINDSTKVYGCFITGSKTLVKGYVDKSILMPNVKVQDISKLTKNNILINIMSINSDGSVNYITDASGVSDIHKFSEYDYDILNKIKELENE